MKITHRRSNVFSNSYSRKHFVVTANSHTIYCDADDSYEEYQGEHDQYEDVWDSIKDIDQEFTSENTSINSTKVPAVFHMVSFEPDTVNVDYGGGRYDSAADYLTQYDVINMVLDPFNRSKAHNREVINLIREHGGESLRFVKVDGLILRGSIHDRNIGENLSPQILGVIR